ncbi:MAG: YceI family protein [Nannocystaceae bacterium]
MTTERQEWEIDHTHSSIHFWVRHLMVSKVHGAFASWRGRLVLGEDDLARSSVHVEIDAASLDTREQRRDEHLRSPDFLDVGAHPTITFESREVAVVADDHLQIRGDLTIRGNTRPITLEVEVGGRTRDPWGGERAGFSATATLDRRDFGLTWNQALEVGGVLVGDKVTITLEIEAIRKAAKAA